MDINYLSKTTCPWIKYELTSGPKEKIEDKPQVTLSDSEDSGVSDDENEKLMPPFPIEENVIGEDGKPVEAPEMPDIRNTPSPSLSDFPPIATKNSDDEDEDEKEEKGEEEDEDEDEEEDEEEYKDEEEGEADGEDRDNDGKIMDLAPESDKEGEDQETKKNNKEGKKEEVKKKVVEVDELDKNMLEKVNRKICKLL